MEVGDQTERHDASTDTIIEELKTLAKYMLEATEAARQRTLSIEGYKSYEALLGALETSAPGTNCIKESTVPQYHCDPVNEISFSGGDELRKKSHNNLPLLLNVAEKSKKGTMCLKQDIYNGGLDTEESSSSEKDEDDVGYSAEDSLRLNQHKISSNTRLANFDCSGDSEENIYDGVKTQIIFKAVDPKLYQEISGCTWLPEPLCIRLDTGETIEDDSEEETADIDDGEDDTKCKKKRVFRVPSFPFGGGVTEGQAQLLSKMFSDAMRRGGLSNSIGPKYITKKEFINYEYEECATTEKSRNSFIPKSPFEFVVELEREVVFDAVQAREERRREFRRLAGEGRAPVTMGSFNLRVIMDPLKTGFEEEKTFPIERGTIVADRYQIIELLGKATFSRAVRCYDLHQPFYEDDDDEVIEPETECIPNDDTEENTFTDGKKRQRVAGYAEVCLKIINNSKDFFDQSLDEIRLLTLINKYKDPDKVHVIRLIDCFYYKEHTMLVTELLSDNLYEYSKYNREEEETFYFTIPRLRRIARQIVEALTYVHSLNLIHADLKPENVLFVSHRRCVVKVIDFGSSCFLSDHLSSYIQSRSYRAPEVIFGCDYDGRIDVWSLGAILAELVTGEVLFTSETVPEMLARIVYVCGQPFPRRMLWEGRHTAKFINKFGCIYEQGNKDGEDSAEDSSYYYLYTPVFQARESQSVDEQDIEKKGDDIADLGDTGRSLLSEGPYSVLRQKLAAHNVSDESFISFVEACLTLDHKKRPRSKDLLSHPFLTQSD
ncbi:protein kinase, putative [Trypanosoma cruzi marinkellei]|uniref:Protein kinase, putative n=1 Tax=Trypanosoma cruzi marinkellei TaxID=85056 RepID=K2ML20_TRYCR|nr:protein kinase, putative [Trypanosoma cruzi marinkellei]